MENGAAFKPAGALHMPENFVDRVPRLLCHLKKFCFIDMLFVFACLN